MSNRGRPQLQPQPQQHYVRGGGPSQQQMHALSAGGGVPPQMIRGPMPPPPGLGPGAQIIVHHAVPPPGPSPGAMQQLEQKLAVQHSEFQQLLTENQRLAATHVALRQELAAAQGEIQRLKQTVGAIQADKDGQLRSILEKANKMQSDLQAAEAVRQEVHAARAEAQAQAGRRQEAEQARAAQAVQMQQMQTEMQRMRAELQHIPGMRQDLDGLQQELQRARQALEFEKKSNVDLVEQRTAMEKNLVSMARDVEKLKAQLANMPKQPASYGEAAYNASAAYGSAYAQPYGDGYGMTALAQPSYVGYAVPQAPIGVASTYGVSTSAVQPPTSLAAAPSRQGQGSHGSSAGYYRR